MKYLIFNISLLKSKSNIYYNIHRMISSYLVGGLGNQLFQIFTVISYAMDYKTNSVFLFNNLTRGITVRKTYWNSFLSSLHSMLLENLPQMIYFRESSFSYEKLAPIPNNEHILLLGYFQSYKYFNHNDSDIFRLIRLEKQKQAVRNKISYDVDNTISMHFRLGDYKYIQDKHPILPISYYINSLHFILKTVTSNKSNLNVLYFCEIHDLQEVQIIINQLENIFPKLSFNHVNTITEDWQQMLLMSCCKYNIIANSTFSWWGAYFNINYQKIVCYPKQWFGPSLKHDTKDLFPLDWNCISNENYI